MSHHQVLMGLIRTSQARREAGNGARAEAKQCDGSPQAAMGQRSLQGV